MDFDVLYSIAIDLINKKRANNWNFSPNDFVCVLMTENKNIFNGMTASDIKDGKLVSSCAEYEAIKAMMGSNETRVKALVNVNVSSLMPSLPCDSCRKLIFEINPENGNCLIMKPDNSFCALKDINFDANPTTSISADDDTSWDMGWDDDTSGAFGMNEMNLEAFTPNANLNKNNMNVNMNTTSFDNPMPNNPVNPNMVGVNNGSAYSSRYINPVPNSPVNPNMVGMNNGSAYSSRYINPIPNNPVNPNMVGMNHGSVYTSRYINPIPNSPVNRPVTNMGNSSTFQSISSKFNPLTYQTSTGQKDTSSNLQSVVTKPTEGTNVKQNSSMFKERLKSIMLDDIMDVETTLTTEDLLKDGSDAKGKATSKAKDSRTSSKLNKANPDKTKALTKKELKVLAKEKKRQAKKNSKILETFEKQSNV